jgi:hypothetical protein
MYRVDLDIRQAVAENFDWSKSRPLCGRCGPYSPKFMVTVSMRNHLSDYLLRSVAAATCGAIALVWLAATGCGPSAASDRHTHTESVSYEAFAGEYPLKVVCTTGQVADMLRNIGGEHVEVASLMGPGVDPHLYRPVPSDIQRLNKADAIFYNGLHLDDRRSQ